eukprot:160621-Rhodomonas_salina.3
MFELKSLNDPPERISERIDGRGVFSSPVEEEVLSVVLDDEDSVLLNTSFADVLLVKWKVFAVIALCNCPLLKEEDAVEGLVAQHEMSGLGIAQLARTADRPGRAERHLIRAHIKRAGL